MAGLTIACPKCQAPLKLKDRSLLGKTGKCPRCAHRFVLQEEVEVALELVDTSTPVEGKNATWIPDTPTPAPTPPAAVPPVAKQQASEQNSLADLFKESAPASTSADPLAFLSGDSIPTTSETAPLAGLGGSSSTATTSSLPVRRKKRKSRSSGGGMMAVAAILIAVGVGGFLYYRSTLPKPAAKTVAQNSAPAAPVAAAPAAPVVAAYNPMAAQSPTSGRPIQLLNMPAGVRVVIQLHPAKLWSNDRQYAEFRASLGPLGTWLETQITQLTKQPPAAIEELLIGIILGPRGTPPEVAAVVHFAQPQQRADLLQTYNGTAHDEFSTDIKLSEGRAYRIVNDQTVAICPEMYVDDLKTFEKSPAMTGDNLQEILKATDRDRLVTVAFDPMDLEQHLETLFPAGAEQVMEKTLRWLSEDVWAAAWSVHVADDFYTELVVRGKNDVGPQTLSKMYQQRLDVLPELLLTSVQKMNPQRSGYRQLIGRFPAMTKVLAMATAVGVDGRFVRLGTLLPAKAAPNLALGTLLTWDESTRTDFSAQTAVVSNTPQKMDISQLPIQERLKVKMDVDFRRTPLQEAFAYIAEECKTPIEIDGDALKLAGYTKNMPQTFSKEQATTLEALYGIIKTYEAEAIPMAIVVDEAANQILVLTTKVATDRGLTPFDFKAAGVK